MRDLEPASCNTRFIFTKRYSYFIAIGKTSSISHDGAILKAYHIIYNSKF
jgi:hypothetical protein